MKKTLISIKLRASIFIMIVGLLLLCKTSMARNFYVDPSSTVTIANGTLTNPWKTISQVNAGTYQFIITDAIGLKDTVNITLSQPDSLKVTVGYSIITSYNTTTTINVTVSGGAPPYQYQIDDGLFQSSNIFADKTAGIYKITVKDANGCTKSVMVNLLVTSITENPDKRLVITVAPNPSSTSFTVNVIKYRGSFVTMNLKVYNSFGQIVYSAQGLSNVTYSFGSNFIPGNYVLVALVDGTVQAVKLVKL